MSEEQEVHTCSRCHKVLKPIHESMPNQWESGMYLEFHGFYGGIIDNASSDLERDLHKLCHKCSHALIRFLKIDDKAFKFSHSHSGQSWCNGMNEQEREIIDKENAKRLKQLEQELNV